MAAGASGPRARYREQTRAEIKQIALAQLAEGGTAAVALTRIAKEVGLSGPALYRYFDSRDALLSDLIRDAYADLGAAVDAAARAYPADGTRRARLQTLAVAVRTWAVAEPHRYLLIEGTPVPGYTAPPDTLDGARAVLGPFLACFEGAEPAAAMRPLVRQMAQWAAEDAAVGAWARSGVGAGGEGTALAGAVLAWTQLHGAVGLEVSGQFRGMGHDGGTLLTVQMDSLADSFGLDRP
ncbi:MULTISPECIES: TetR/AcrR family transcriptional regulator [unclassified Streptomyces]|uniref:TetR/AcrR family transcriptional regulator n=1 Tax=unclassified Streptomyces TaxID=2593676 RepID=UPI001F04293A|nr:MULTISPECIES: TetR/AcrR family transcriptional regulator [unclassified Streptomyces]MCH0565418.1 TetR/AcrR family transcriptional regulator [Streptomyces sp. MUM 2J]MCH0568213.1 TetR/AcrR family transcriptional regulator [Streptomyces sp. MUM 136J]